MFFFSFCFFFIEVQLIYNVVLVSGYSDCYISIYIKNLYILFQILFH